MSLLAAFFALAFAPVQAPTAADVIAHVRKAVGYEKLEANPQGWQVTGSGRYFGESSKYDLLFSPSGEFVERVVGPLGTTHAFDGKTAWEADWTGATRTLALRDRELTQASMAFQTGLWLGPRSPFEASVVPDVDAGLVTLELKVKGGVHATRVEIDAKTWIPKREFYNGPAGECVTSLGDWRETAAGLLPHRVEVSEGGLTNTVSVGNVERAPTFIRNPYERLPWMAADTTFDASASPDVELKRLATGHLMVHPTVNGKDVGWFLLDTGAGSMVIDPKVADELAMPKVGEIPVVGVGGALLGSFRLGEAFKLGPMEMRGSKYVEIDLAVLTRVFRTKIAGIVGYDLLRRAVLTLDLPGKTLQLQDPERYTLTTGSWTPLILDGKHPIVEARFEGDRRGMFRLDTGASGTVTLAGAVAKTLLEGRETRPAVLGGVGGILRAKTGTLEWFELAGHRFEKPLVTFMEGETGALSNAFLAGNIGQDFLLPFTLVFDYGHERIAFLPKAGVDQYPGWARPGPGLRLPVAASVPLAARNRDGRGYVCTRHSPPRSAQLSTAPPLRHASSASKSSSARARPSVLRGVSARIPKAGNGS